MYKLMQIESVKSYGPHILEWISGHQHLLRIPGNDHVVDITRGVPSTRLYSRTISIQRVYQRFDCRNQHE